jgi:hypothetical protein
MAIASKLDKIRYNSIEKGLGASLVSLNLHVLILVSHYRPVLFKLSLQRLLPQVQLNFF